MLLEKLPKTTALIHQNDTFLSSGIIFKHSDELYSITAGHTVYGKKFDEPIPTKEIRIKAEAGTFGVDEIIGDNAFAKQHDIVLLKLNNIEYQHEQLIEINFSTAPRNQLHDLMFRGKYEQGVDIYNWQKGITYDEEIKGTTHYRIDFPSNLLSNSTFSFGHNWLGGISGSGLFYKGRKEIVCCGIVCEIPENGDVGKLECGSISPLKQLLPSLKIFESSQFNYDEEFNKDSILAIINRNEEEAVLEWEKVNENSKEVKLVNKKLPYIYSQTQLQRGKSKLLRNYRIGQDLIENELNNKEFLRKEYDLAYNTYDIKDKFYYVDGRRDAKAKYDELKKSYENHLTSELSKKGFPQNLIILLTEYGVARWITDCSLDFENDED